MDALTKYNHIIIYYELKLIDLPLVEHVYIYTAHVPTYLWNLKLNS